MNQALQMGCSISCSTFECFSSFLKWALMEKVGYGRAVHYLDVFLLLRWESFDQCDVMLDSFVDLTAELGIPLAHAKNKRLNTETSFSEC